MRWPEIDLSNIVAEVLERPGPVRLVAVDGRGGAGKTTFATALATAADGAPMVHTDDFADRAGGGEWWPDLLREVVAPLMEGHPTGIQAAPIVIIEGVSSGRREWADQLAFVIWVEAPAATRHERILERDGPAAADHWAAYEAEEGRFFAADPVRSRADLVVESG